MTLPLIVAIVGDGIPSHPDAPCVLAGPAWAGHARSSHDRREAAAACAGCPILEACRQGAEDRRERFGVWGGEDRETAYRDRYRAPDRPRRVPAQCGTPSGYKRHRGRGEDACAACRTAAAADTRNRRAQRLRLTH